MKLKGWVLGVAIMGGTGVWIVDAVLDATIFYEGTFWDLLILDVPPHEIYVRLLFFGYFLIFGLIMSAILAHHEETEKALRQSEANLRTLLDSMDDMVLVLGLDGVFKEYYQPTAHHHLSRPPKEIVGRHCSEVLDPEIDAEVRAAIQAIRGGEGAQHFDYSQETEKGTCWYNAIVSPVFDKANTLVDVIIVVRDITELRRTIEAFKTSEEMQRVLMETAAQGIVLVNERGEIARVNAMTERLFDCNRDDLIGESLNILIPFAVRDRHTDLCAGFFDTPHARPMGIGLDLTAQRCDGEEFPVEVSLSYVETKEGGVTMALVTDITERKRAADALEAQKEELDAFAHTVAHDLKGPLSQIVGFSDVLTSDDEEPLPEEDQQLALRSISRSARKMANIIDEILLLASVRKEGVETGPVDMASVVEGALDRVDHLARRHQAEFIVPESWPAAEGYAAWVEEVWTNYLSNAIKYGGDPPHVELGAETGDGVVRFWVRDNGEGLTDEEQKRLFKPFTRLDTVRVKGHGLGLSIARRIVERLGGAVGVESAPGEGSMFWFTLPA